MSYGVFEAQEWASQIRQTKPAKKHVELLILQTKEQYVGMADGHDGFWERWQSYMQTGHDGDVALMNRDPSVNRGQPSMPLRTSG